MYNSTIVNKKTTSKTNQTFGSSKYHNVKRISLSTTFQNHSIEIKDDRKGSSDGVYDAVSKFNCRVKKWSSIICIALFITCFSSCKSLRSDKLTNRNYFLNDSIFFNSELRLTGNLSSYSNSTKNNGYKRNINKFRKKHLVVHGESPSGSQLYVYHQNIKNAVINPSQESSMVYHDTLKKQIVYKRDLVNSEVSLLIQYNNKENQDSLLRIGKRIIDSFKEKDSLRYYDIFFANVREPNLLYVGDKIEHAPIDKSERNNNQKFVVESMLYVNDVKSEKYVEVINKRNAELQQQYSSTIDSVLKMSKHYIGKKAIDQIILSAQQHRVVMLNETHRRPSDRILAYKLLEPLKKLGYKYLAIEALVEGQDSVINITNYPTRKSGFYISEPFFGLFIRKARELGFKLVAYDIFKSESEREESEAKNLMKIYDGDPNAKVFVYAGWRHIVELGQQKTWMAEYFKNYTGIDPLTINQAEGAKSKIKDNIYLVNNSNFDGVGRIIPNVDYFLVNKIQPNLNEIFSAENLSTNTLRLEKLKNQNDEALFVMIFYNHEYKKEGLNALPIINRIIKENVLQIALPRNQKFTVIIFNKENQIISHQIISSTP